jgi:Tfp pilus assembly protein PilV
MQKVWLHTKLNARGFSTVEVLLAATIFGMIAMAIVGALVYGNQATADAGEHGRATMLAQEGLEAVRNIRDGQDATYVNTTGAATYGLAQTGNQWTLSGSSDVSGIFTRQVTITPIDTARKNITVTVSWLNGATTSQVTATGRLSNWLASIVPPVTSGPIMMAYSKTTTTPFYRIWDGSNWGAEASAQNVVGNINYIVLKSSRTRNESILGVQTSTGAIYVQVWNGTSWGNLTQVGTGPTTTRSFDIAYEKNSDEALIAYTPSLGAVDFAYRTWNGTTLSAATAVANSPTTGAINWMELKQNPLSGSNEVAMILLDANADVYGMAWTGSAWSTMGTAAVWDASAASATKKTIDVEYEQTSGRAMFMWGDAVATDQYYRTWNGTTLSAATLLDIATEGGVPEWIQLAARPNSNEIMLGVQDAGADLNTRKWSGSAWDTATQHPEHSAATENILSRNFDIIWETHSSNPGKAWLMWGDSLTVTAKQWSGTAWGAGAVQSGSDDTSFVRLRADPVSGAVFAGIYQNATAATTARDINERRLIGGSATWTAKNTIWGGPTSTDPVFFRIDIATP